MVRLHLLRQNKQPQEKISSRETRCWCIHGYGVGVSFSPQAVHNCKQKKKKNICSRIPLIWLPELILMNSQDIKILIVQPMKYLKLYIKFKVFLKPLITLCSSVNITEFSQTPKKQCYENFTCKML